MDNKHKLALGHFGLARAADLKDAPHLLAGDLRYCDKQNWPGVCRIFSEDTKAYLTGLAKSEPRVLPTLAYVEFGFRLMRMATGDNPKMEDAGVDVSSLHAVATW